MSMSGNDWPPSQHSWPHGLETEHRLTTLEIRQEGQDEAIEDHGRRHDRQDTWNKGFTVALMGLGAGVAHTKAGDWIAMLSQFLAILKP